MYNVSMSYLKKSRQNEIDVKINEVLLATDKSYPDNGLEEIIESYGNIKTSEATFDFAKDQILGAIVYGDDNPRIIINKDLSPARKTFTLAHEFGHFILHKEQDLFRLDFVNYDDSEDALKETEANYFEASLLMPKERFLEIFALLKREKLVAEYFGVSVDAVRNRMTWIKEN